MAGTSLAGSFMSATGSIIGANAKAAGSMYSANAQAVGGDYAAETGAAAGNYAAEAGREGAYLRAAASEQGGLFSEQEADFTARGLEGAAAEARGAAQREAFEKRHAAKMALSTLVARAAASGGGATDRTVLKLGENIADRGEFQALMDMYSGNNRARGLEDQAMGARMTGAAKKWAAGVDALGARYAGDTGVAAARFSGEAGINAAKYAGASGINAAGIYGEGEKTASKWNAAGTILSGVGSAFKTAKYA